MSEPTKLDLYTEKRKMPLSFLTQDLEEELTLEDYDQMKQINQFPIFKKRIDAHIRKAFKSMTKETYDVVMEVMDRLATFAGEFEEAQEVWEEKSLKQKQLYEMAMPNPFVGHETDESAGEIPEDT